MPELPEVESLRRSLEPRLLGRFVRHARLLRADVCSPLPRASRDRASHLLQHATITSLERRGKQLALVADNQRTLIIQLGMSGQVLLLPDQAAVAVHTHVHAVWTIDPDTVMVFRDPRRFGGLRPFPTRHDLDAVAWKDLGRDALAIQGRELEEAAGRSARSIKAVLLDQSVLAGVGNIYADESLFLARIHPLTPARELRHHHWDSLAHAIRDTLHAAIAQGGSTLRDYVDALGRSGSAALSHRVYGRRELPCLTCATPLSHTLIAQRSTVWCPRCQPSPRHPR